MRSFYFFRGGDGVKGIVHLVSLCVDRVSLRDVRRRADLVTRLDWQIRVREDSQAFDKELVNLMERIRGLAC